ncbi:MAG: DUF4846 domain-containing protein [Oscillospiraceae bacterium]|nr:DUF4846 domain-containing protein [Oscillospiraceae bacterium]
MTVWKLTKKQLIIRLTMPVCLLLVCYALLCLRAARHWRAADLKPDIAFTSENPYINPAGMTQETRILPPEGYTRVPAAADSFLAFMRQQTLYPDGSGICTFKGEQLSGANAAAVYDLTLGAEGYQQCADTVIRFWSDYFRTSGQTAKLAFHLTNGMCCDYETFSSGKRVLAFGDFSMWLKLKGRSDTEQTYRDWLMTVQHYAGTLSLEAESYPILPEEARAGDIICRGGSPGHVVLLADEAVSESGSRAFLLAQGLIPSQNAHLLYAGDSVQNPWITQEQLHELPVRAGAYTFYENTLRRWGDGFPNAAEE